MTIINLPIVSKKKECGTCTKCCEGWLKADINDQKIFPGKPCIFVRQNPEDGFGCNNYKDRPENPCKTYRCFWLDNESVPDAFKPENTGVIIDILEIRGFICLRLNPAPKSPDVHLLSWAFKYAYTNGLNMYWDIDGQTHWVGSLDFVDMMNKNER